MICRSVGSLDLKSEPQGPEADGSEEGFGEFSGATTQPGDTQMTKSFKICISNNLFKIHSKIYFNTETENTATLVYKYLYTSYPKYLASCLTFYTFLYNIRQTRPNRLFLQVPTFSPFIL